MEKSGVVKHSYSAYPMFLGKPAVLYYYAVSRYIVPNKAAAESHGIEEERFNPPFERPLLRDDG